MGGLAFQLPGNGAVLFPDGPIWGEQTRGERGREVLVAGGGMTPSLVSYLFANPKT